MTWMILTMICDMICDMCYCSVKISISPCLRMLRKIIGDYTPEQDNDIIHPCCCLIHLENVVLVAQSAFEMLTRVGSSLMQWPRPVAMTFS